MKCTRKSKIPPLVVLGDHCAQIPTRYHAINGFICQKKLLMSFYSSGEDLCHTDKESEISEPKLDDSSDKPSEFESELGSQVEGDDADEGDEPEDSMENDPPLNMVASTPSANASLENSEGERIVLAGLITSNLRGKKVSDDSMSLSLLH